MLNAEAVIYDRERAQIGRLVDESGQSFIRKVGKYPISPESSAVVDFLAILIEQPHPNLLVPLGIYGEQGEALIEDYPDLSQHDRLDSAGPEIRAGLSCGKLALGQVVDFMAQICDGVDFIHKNGFVHRDVRDPNVFVERDDSGRLKPRLFDYDFLGRPVIQEHGLTIANVETPPEAFVGPVLIDERFDVFQLGFMLGKLTHYEGGLGTWRPVTSLGFNVPSIINRAVGPVDSRFADAGQMRDQLMASIGL